MHNYHAYSTTDHTIEYYTDSIQKKQAHDRYIRISEEEYKELGEQFYTYCDTFHEFTGLYKKYHLWYYTIQYLNDKINVFQYWNDKIVFEEYNWINSDRKQFYYKIKDDNLKTTKRLQTVVRLGPIQLEYFVEFNPSNRAFTEQDIEAVWDGPDLLYSKHPISGVNIPPLKEPYPLLQSIITELVRTQPEFIYQNGI